MNSTQRRPKGIYILPNLFTICSIFAGLFSIVSSFKGNHEIAAMAIVFSMIMDSLDGKVARLTNTMTQFGAQFDSMADMVSFAVAPAILVYTWNLFALGKFGWIAIFIYTVAVALRLARFNTQPEHYGKRYFQGIPCPAGAAIITSLVWVGIDLNLTGKAITIATAVATITAGVLMVSNIRYRSFKDADFKNNVPFVVMLIVALVIALISIDPPKLFFALFVGYAISGPISTIWGLKRKKQLRKHHKHKA